MNNLDEDAVLLTAKRLCPMTFNNAGNDEAKEKYLDEIRLVLQTYAGNVIEENQVTILENRLEEINDIIYSVGLPLGSTEYFAVRGLCCEHLHKVSVHEFIARREKREELKRHIKVTK